MLKRELTLCGKMLLFGILYLSLLLLFLWIYRSGANRH